MKKTLLINALLLVLVLGLGALLYFKPKPEEPKPVEHKLSTLKPEEIKRLEGKLRKGDPVVLELEGEQWYLTKPFRARADNFEARRLADLVRAVSDQKLPATDLSRFELEPPFATVILDKQTFTFGTRLTNITRCLRSRDPDVAMQLADQQVDDWKGGTRIGTCLEDFNRHWARRVLGQNAAVLLVTDGLDRDGEGQLTLAAGHLHRMAHQIVWLNPLLRFDGFEPRAAGVRALLPHVDRFLPVHNLASLADLGRALRAPALRPALLLKH